MELNVEDLGEMNILLLVMGSYLVLAVANTMFMSKEDMRSWPVLVVMAAILGVLIFVSGFWQVVAGPVMGWIVIVSQSLVASFMMVIVINSVMIVGLYLWEMILSKITKKRVI